jgi:hypothetical protein
MRKVRPYLNPGAGLDLSDLVHAANFGDRMRIARSNMLPLIHPRPGRRQRSLNDERKSNPAEGGLYRRGA